MINSNYNQKSGWYDKFNSINEKMVVDSNNKYKKTPQASSPNYFNENTTNNTPKPDYNQKSGWYDKFNSINEKMVVDSNNKYKKTPQLSIASFNTKVSMYTPPLVIGSASENAIEEAAPGYNELIQKIQANPNYVFTAQDNIILEKVQAYYDKDEPNINGFIPNKNAPNIIDFDTNADGEVSLNECNTFLKTIMPGFTCSNAEFQKYDSNGDGKLNLNEYNTFCNQFLP